MPILKDPTSLLGSSMEARKDWWASTMRCACSRNVTPAEVGSKPSPPRTNRQTPRSCSRLEIRLDTAACVRQSFSAVALMLLSLASHSAVSRNRIFIEHRCVYTGAGAGHDRQLAFQSGSVHRPDVLRVIKAGGAVLCAAVVP